VRDIFRKILGVRFYIGDLEGLLARIQDAGLVVVPSAPVMVRLADDPAHREAVEGADMAVTDSSFMVLLWLLKTGERVTRISGLRLMRAIVAGPDFRKKGETFWVMPSEADSDANLEWLRVKGFEVGGEDAYVAPMYPRTGPLSDEALVRRILEARPRMVVIGLSGGVQERLGYGLLSQLDYRPTILCIGGAIAFLSGRQTRIPVWADRLALGWVLRFLSAPRSFSAKLEGVGRLLFLIFRHGERSVAAP
jgi:UDP-N-acetyl-D-mannosaminuronic acid transferase (WecB/TagA/CpsF family)